MNKEKLNDFKVLPLIEEKFNPETVQGHEMFTNPYASICCIAATKSGKTTVVYRSLERRLVKGMTVVIFCPSHAHDHTYKLMKDMIRQKECKLYAHDHFRENGQNLIMRYLNEDKLKKEEVKRDIPPIKTDENRKQFAQEKKEKIKEKGKKHSKTVFIFDDLANEMSAREVTDFLARSRHWKASVYINIHDVIQLKPAALRQVTDVILFPNLSSERIRSVSDKMGLIFKCDTNRRYFLEDLYDDATAEPYNFLACNRPDRVFRKNFSEQYVIDEYNLGKSNKNVDKNIEDGPKESRSRKSPKHS